MGLFSILSIIWLHYKCLIEDSTKQRVITIFGIIPLLISIVLVYFGFIATLDAIKIITTIIGVLVAFSISALMQLTSQVRDSEPNKHHELVELTRIHTMYVLDLGISLLALAGFLFISKSAGQFGDLGDIASSILLYTGFLHFLLTLYLLPARLFTIGEKVDLE